MTEEKKAIEVVKNILYGDKIEDGQDVALDIVLNLIEEQQKVIEETEREKNNFHNLYVDRHIKVSKYEDTISKIQELIDRYNDLDYLSANETLLDIEELLDKNK